MPPWKTISVRSLGGKEPLVRKRIVGLVASAALIGLIGAPPAFAHEGHASCGEGTHAFIVPLAQSRLAGETASAQARLGILNEQVAAAHAALCEPRP